MSRGTKNKGEGGEGKVATDSEWARGRRVMTIFTILRMLNSWLGKHTIDSPVAWHISPL